LGVALRHGSWNESQSANSSSPLCTAAGSWILVVAHKFACGGSTQVESDLAENHGRHVARSYLQNLADAVGSIVQAKEETWHYATPRA
jgi:hypothetical protein